MLKIASNASPVFFFTVMDRVLERLTIKTSNND